MDVDVDVVEVGVDLDINDEEELAGEDGVVVKVVVEGDVVVEVVEEIEVELAGVVVSPPFLSVTVVVASHWSNEAGARQASLFSQRQPYRSPSSSGPILHSVAIFWSHL